MLSLDNLPGAIALLLRSVLACKGYAGGRPTSAMNNSNINIITSAAHQILEAASLLL